MAEIGALNKRKTYIREEKSRHKCVLICGILKFNETISEQEKLIRVQTLDQSRDESGVSLTIYPKLLCVFHICSYIGCKHITDNTQPILFAKMHI